MSGASASPAVRPAAISPRSAPRFCSVCGAERIEFRIPDGDTLPRHVCGASVSPALRPAAISPRSAPRFCSVCGAERIEFRIPDGDTLPRHVCGACATIHYQNPKIVVGCLPELDDRVLLCLRAIEPRRGLWTLPAGFLENGETLTAGAMRETLEEANARVALGALYTIISLPHIGQVYMMFRARLLDRDFGPGAESLEVRLFGEDEIPWEELAFRTIGRTLRNYFLDRKLGAFDQHVSALERKAPRPDLSGAG